MAGRLYIEALNTARLLDDIVIDKPVMASPNLAPRHWLSMLRLEQGQIHLGRAFWGMTPSWLKVLDHAPHCARAESLDDRRMFREAFSARRCLIPVSGVYIWKQMPRQKQPFLVTRVDRAPFMLAGIWCRYMSDIRTAFDSMALITVEVDAPLTPLTDRFPAVIGADQAMAWLSPDTPTTRARELLSPAPPALLGAFPVERLVNDPANQNWHCARPTGHMMTATRGAIHATGH